MFNRGAFENSRPDGIGVLEIVPSPNGMGEKEEVDAPRRFVPLRRSELAGEVAGPLAALRLTQTYGYAAEQCADTIEAVYRFPLPGDAAVRGVTVRFGAVEIAAELRERRAAEEEYKAAREEGRQAALATRESPDVFTLQVAGLRPGEDVTVETRYVQLARAEGTGYALRVPLTTAPRYVRADERGSRHAAGNPLLVMRDPGHRFALDLTLRGVGAVESPTHDLDVSDVAGEGGVRRVRLRGGEVLPDRDCVLRWQPAREAERPALQVLAHDDPASRWVYFLALVAPPAGGRAGGGVPREVALLVDHSGSMDGPKWDAADWAVKRFLSDLTPDDAFALGLFHDSTRWFAGAPRPADAGTVEEAIGFLERHRDSGGTNLGVVLEQALDLPRAAGERARHVLVITDAEVTDAGRVLRLADREAGRDDRRRVSVLCIDAAPNSSLASELAERGGGVARFLTSAPDEEDITTALDETLADWAAPVLTGLKLEVDWGGAEAAGRAIVRASERGWS
ncbi:MAG: VIT and VWA domain-containing protein, partial [Chloroflexota bacterium]|nr:VIT and VWA domain-containing protein [Chloroflexota bacterium]